MRIALISPFSSGPVRGNITTVNRISRFLRLGGVELLVLSVDTLSSSEMELQLRSFSPHLIHSFHAHYCGRIAYRLSVRLNLPFAITITGSDLHNPLMRVNPDTIRAIEAANAVVCFDDNGAAELANHFPRAANRVTVISQGVEAIPYIAADSPEFAENAFVLLLPAALRPVKQIEFPLQALASVGSRLPAVRLAIAGGIIDNEYAAAIFRMLRNAPHGIWLGEIPHERMGALYARADVVLNCSASESMPNTLLEAMALDRPVLAMDISGNRTLVSHGNTGLLYRDQNSFIECVTRLESDAGLRTALGQRAGEFVRGFFSPQKEAEAYIRLFQTLTGHRS